MYKHMEIKQHTLKWLVCLLRNLGRNAKHSHNKMKTQLAKTFGKQQCQM
jgi:hypothetical protein